MFQQIWLVEFLWHKPSLVVDSDYLLRSLVYGRFVPVDLACQRLVDSKVASFYRKLLLQTAAVGLCVRSIL